MTFTDSTHPGDDRSGQRRYPWSEWTDGSVWEIRRGVDYDVATENMRVNLHMKADGLAIKVRTRKVNDESGEGLVFQFVDPEGEEMRKVMAQAQPAEVTDAMEQLFADAIEIYDRARGGHHPPEGWVDAEVRGRPVQAADREGA